MEEENFLKDNRNMIKMKIGVSKCRNIKKTKKITKKKQ